jgi:hypothetical protein
MLLKQTHEAMKKAEAARAFAERSGRDPDSAELLQVIIACHTELAIIRDRVTWIAAILAAILVAVLRIALA